MWRTEQTVKEDEWGKKTEQKGRQVPCEHFNILEICRTKKIKNPYLCTDGASKKKTCLQTNKKKFKK